jgi:cytochrome P450
MTTAPAAFDHLDSSLSAADVRRAHAEMRERCPVVHSDRHGGFDYVTRYADVRAALTDPATFSSADGVKIPANPLLPPVPALESSTARSPRAPCGRSSRCSPRSWTC